MYIGIDVGGTKTIVACLDDNGVILESLKFQTPKDYAEFLAEVRKALDGFNNKQFIAGAAGIPAIRYDRKTGITGAFGNLPWRNVNIAKDLPKIVGCPLYIENDAKLGALSESMLIKDRYSKVLYIAIGTGIGYALVDGLKIDTDAGDGGGRIMLVNRDNKLVPWESIASGHAINERYHKMAKDIDDQETWQAISKDLAEGFEELIAVFQPEVIIVGGSVGKYFNKYGEMLKKELNSYQLSFVTLPDIMGAQRPDDAVVYGCYDYAKQQMA